MGLFGMERSKMATQLNTMQGLFVEELRDLYSAENQLVKALPQMVAAAKSNTLKSAFEKHLEETRHHVTRLTEVFSELGASPTGKHCKGMEGLIAEGNEVLQMQGDADVKDAALIGAAQRIEHYEMAGYGVARTFAKELGYGKLADKLQKTLDEEGSANKKLTSIAEGGLFRKGVNEKAVEHR
jgi:ferritin-like metal-binding protein YciE